MGINCVEFKDSLFSQKLNVSRIPSEIFKIDEVLDHVTVLPVLRITEGELTGRGSYSDF